MWERIAAQVTKKSKLQCSTFIINTRNPLERYKGKEIILALRFVLGVPYVQLLLLIKSKRHSEDQIIQPSLKCTSKWSRDTRGHVFAD